MTDPRRNFSGSTTDLINALSQPPKAYYRYCGCCGAHGFRWEQTDKGWRLVGPDGRKHWCDEGLHLLPRDLIIDRMGQNSAPFVRAIAEALWLADEDEFKTLKRAFEGLWLEHAELVDPDAVGTVRRKAQNRSPDWDETNEGNDTDDELPF